MDFLDTLKHHPVFLKCAATTSSGMTYNTQVQVSKFRAQPNFNFATCPSIYYSILNYGTSSKLYSWYYSSQEAEFILADIACLRALFYTNQKDSLWTHKKKRTTAWVANAVIHILFFFRLTFSCQLVQVSHEIQQQPLKSSPPQKKEDLEEEGLCEQLWASTEPDIPFSCHAGKNPTLALLI